MAYNGRHISQRFEYNLMHFFCVAGIGISDVSYNHCKGLIYLK